MTPKCAILRIFAGFVCVENRIPAMASIYQRPNSKNFCLSCYPRPGAKLLRASLATDNEAEAEKVARAVELLIELEKKHDLIHGLGKGFVDVNMVEDGGLSVALLLFRT